MPKPTSRGTASQPSNPFQAFLQRRKDHKMSKEEERAKQVINDAARSETEVIKTLQSISFLRSKLPKEYLEFKSNPNNALGDLEDAKQSAIDSLNRATTATKVDMKPIDARLLQIATRYKNAIEQGDLNTAFAAKAALNTGVEKIRSRVPAVPEENVDNFIKKSAEYLGDWCTMIDLATAFDDETRRVDELTANVAGQEADWERQKEELKASLEGDEDFQIAYRHIMEHDSTSDRLKWNSRHWEVFDSLLQRRLSKLELGMARATLSNHKALLQLKKSRLDSMQTNLSALRDTDPVDLLNSFDEAMDRFFDDLAQADTEIAESMKKINEFEGRLKQLELGPGNQALKETVAEEAEAFLREMKEEQDEELENLKPGGNLLREFGISTDEEHNEQMEQLRQEQEQVRRQEQQEVHQQRQTLYEG